MHRASKRRFLSYAVILLLIGSISSLTLPAFKQSYSLHENITVNVADDIDETYQENDLVTIDGVIEDVIENEEVIINIGEPGDPSPDQVQSDEPASNGGFDYVYEVPNSPEEGVYTVEVEYENDDPAYTYFIVDDADDTITLALDESTHIYQAGDSVTVSGQVDNEDIDLEEFVHVIVLDPMNGEVADENQVELGEGDLPFDEFEFEFNLDNDAPHGRYAVMVTYDIDDQEGSTLFEIEDDDTGGSGGSAFTGDEDTVGDLTVQIENDAYDPGDRVRMEGTIDNYDSGDNDELAIEVEDPDDVEVSSYGENDLSVQSDGDFVYDFVLTGTAEAGTYSVISTYAGDVVTLTFEVEGTSTGGSGGITGGVTMGDLTAKLDKASYLAGETMIVSGTADEVADESDNELLSVLVYRPNGVVILGASKYITPSANGAFSTNIVLDSSLDADDDYKVIVSYLGDDVALPFDITGVSSSPSDQISIDTNQDEYTASSNVVISGDVPDNMIVQGQNAFLVVKKPDGNPCRTDQITIPSSGSFSYSMPLGGNCGVAGEYDVEITYNGRKGTTTFIVTGSSGGGNGTQYTLIVNGINYRIDYELTDGSINRMFARPAEDKLIVELLNADLAGQLTLVLPRTVIDAVENGQDVSYIVTIEDGSGTIETVEVEESGNTNATRTVVIDYPAGASRIEIAGTQVVPEFGSIAAITLAVAIVGIIVVTTMYGGKKFNLFGQ